MITREIQKVTNLSKKKKKGRLYRNTFLETCVKNGGYPTERERLIEALIGTFKWLYAESTSLEMQKKKKILIREFDILWL